jgi:hypothetical protein
MNNMTRELKNNKIYSDIFSLEELEILYNAITDDTTNRTEIVPIYAQKVWFVEIPSIIVDKVTSIMKDIHKQEVKLEEICFARYSKEYGEFPVLTPHFDNTFKEPRVTFDVQLNANIKWPIVVEGKSFLLKDNQAMTFSGTHQVHWRDPINFKDGDFIEMLFCHFSLPNAEAITMEEMSDTINQLVFHTNRFSMKLIKENKQLKDLTRKISNE